MTVMMTLFYDVPVALAPERPLSSDLVIECLANLDADGVALPPVLLEEMSQSEEKMGALARMNVVAYAGGEFHFLKTLGLL